MHKTSNCLILFLIEVVQFFSIVLYYVVSFHSEYSNIWILNMDFMFSLDPSLQSQITNIEGMWIWKKQIYKSFLYPLYYYILTILMKKLDFSIVQ